MCFTIKSVRSTVKCEMNIVRLSNLKNNLELLFTFVSFIPFFLIIF